MLDREALVESYRGQLQVVLESKVEEFQMFGYDRVTDDDIWKFLKVKKWKKIDSDVRLYELVNDVLTVTANEYMTYLTVEAKRHFGHLMSTKINNRLQLVCSSFCSIMICIDKEEIIMSKIIYKGGSEEENK